jgi:hypothetical protein
MFRDTVCRAICVTANRPTRGVVSVYEPLRGLCKPMERKISEIISLDSTTPRSSLAIDLSSIAKNPATRIATNPSLAGNDCVIEPSHKPQTKMAGVHHAGQSRNCAQQPP